MANNNSKNVIDCPSCGRVVGVFIEVFNHPGAIHGPWRISRHSTVAKGKNGGTICGNSRTTVDASRVRPRKAPVAV